MQRENSKSLHTVKEKNPKTMGERTTSESYELNNCEAHKILDLSIPINHSREISLNI